MPTAPRPWVRHHQLLADRRLQSQQQYGQYRAAVRRRRRSLLIGGRGRRRNCDTHTTLVGGYGETVASLGPNCLSVCLLNIFLSPSFPCPPPLALSLSPLKNRSNDQLIWRALLCPVLVGTRRVCVCVDSGSLSHVSLLLLSCQPPLGFKIDMDWAGQTVTEQCNAVRSSK